MYFGGRRVTETDAQPKYPIWGDHRIWLQRKSRLVLFVRNAAKLRTVLHPPIIIVRPLIRVKDAKESFKVLSA
jgi:hypothetical protein